MVEGEIYETKTDIWSGSMFWKELTGDYKIPKGTRCKYIRRNPCFDELYDFRVEWGGEWVYNRTGRDGLFHSIDDELKSLRKVG